jgi:phosphoribosylformylglycinamidine (FGAM) synthase PurS component
LVHRQQRQVGFLVHWFLGSWLKNNKRDFVFPKEPVNLRTKIPFKRERENMLYQIEISLNPQFRDKHGEHVKHEITELGVKGISEVRYSPVYRLEGNISRQEAERIASRLLIDPITEQYSIIEISSTGRGSRATGHDTKSVEIWFKRGVTDTVAESVAKAVKDIGVKEALKIDTGHKFVIKGKLTAAVIKQAAGKILYNPMIQECVIQ